MKSSSSTLFHKGAGANPEVNRHLSPGCPGSRLPYCGHAIERSRQADLGDDQRKGFRFDPAQGGTSLPNRRHRESLFGKDLSHQGLRSLVAVYNEDLTL